VRLTAAQAIVRYLSVQWSERDGERRRAVPGIWGIFGHGNVLGLGPALDEDAGRALAFHQPKTEQGMVHAAIGYAKASRGLATMACTASIGPGSTNMVTGAATATVNRVPVLLLPSDTFANRRQGPVMQALDHGTEGDVTVNDAFRPVSAWFDRIARPEQLLAALPAAMRVLLDPAETGAVTLSLHQDMQAESFEVPPEFLEPRTWHVPRRPPAPSEVAAAVDLLRRARRPLIVAGGGVHYSDATAELAAFAEAFGIPVAESSAGKGALPSGPLAVGGLGVTGTRAANELARAADAVVCVGTRLVDLVTGSHSLFQDPDVRFVGINVRPRDAARLGAVPVVGDARAALVALGAAMRETGWRAPGAWAAWIAEARDGWREELENDLAPRDGERMSQGQALRALNDGFGPRDRLVVASGTPHVEVHKLWEGGGVHMEVGFSCMGHEIPAALGVRLAGPDAGEVYAVIGDGTYLMAPTELVTAVQEGLKITVVLFDNHGYQSIHRLQRGHTERSFGLELRRRAPGGLTGPYVEVDFAGNARSLGCAAFVAGTVPELEAALAAAREEPRPVVIVCPVETHRPLLDSECWWDVGVAGAEDARARAGQRWYG
jgi:3D-(3,5/4)-trihydroxycyclohexane-1,2-dione acylhydrolase (decyclizing)